LRIGFFKLETMLGVYSLKDEDITSVVVKPAHRLPSALLTRLPPPITHPALHPAPTLILVDLDCDREHAPPNILRATNVHRCRLLIASQVVTQAMCFSLRHMMIPTGMFTAFSNGVLIKTSTR
jgi:hypothetical protein